MISKTLSDLAKHVGGKVIGDGSVLIHKVSPIDRAGPGEISFLTNPRYQRFLPQCHASAVIVAHGVVSQIGPIATLSYLESADPYIAFAKILQLLSPAPTYSQTTSAAAHVDSSAIIAPGVTVFPNVYIGARAHIGPNAVLFPGVYIGADVEVGAGSMLHANVVVRDGCRVGERVILHAGVVIGSDGFGYAGAGAGRVKIPQVGIVVVEDDVEIGANTTVDRATLGQTVVGRGAKIDNLVQIAHNVVIGEHSVIAAQAGIAGSTRIGKNVTLLGQVGVANHLEVGDGATIGPQSGLVQSVPAGALLSSALTAAPHREWLKVMVLLPQLPKLWSTVRSLEKQLARLIASSKKDRSGD